MAKEYVFDKNGNRITVLRGSRVSRDKKRYALSKKFGTLITIELPKISKRKESASPSSSIFCQLKPHRNYTTIIMKGKKLLQTYCSMNPNDLRIRAMELSLELKSDVSYLDEFGFFKTIKYEPKEVEPGRIYFWKTETEMNDFIEKRTGIPAPEKPEKPISTRSAR